MAGILNFSIKPLSSVTPSLGSQTQFPKTRYRIRTNSYISIQNPSIIHLKFHPRFIVTPISASSPNPINDDGGITNNSGNVLEFTRPLLNFAANNFLPLALVGGVAFGLATSSLGCLADQYSFSKVSTFCIFIISGLTLRSQEIGAARDAWPVGIFGLASILLLTPVFSRLILQLNFQPQEFVTGTIAKFMTSHIHLHADFIVKWCLAYLGGNFALALAMTVISNLLGILVVPFTVSKYVAAGVGISIPTGKLLKSLVATLLIPLILGKVLREAIDGVANFADNNRKLLSIMNAVFLSLVPWIQVSKSRSLLLMVNPTGFLLAIGLGAILHIVLLAFNALAIKTLSFLSGGKKSVFSNTQNAIALLLVASQKTLPVTVAVVDQLGGAMGASGLLVLPCVAAHLNQIILDSVLVNSFLRKDQSDLLSKAS